MKVHCPCCHILYTENEFLRKDKYYSLCRYCEEIEDNKQYTNNKIIILSEIYNKEYIGNNLMQVREKKEIWDGHILTTISNKYINKEEFYKKLWENRLDIKYLGSISYKLFLIELGYIEKDYRITIKEDREYIRLKYNHRCFYCGRKGTSVDHKVLLISGGTDNLSNMVNSCTFCNQLKGDLSYEKFMYLNKHFEKLNKKLVELDEELENLDEYIEQVREKYELIEDIKDKKPLHWIIQESNSVKDKKISEKTNLEKKKRDIVVGYTILQELKEDLDE